MAKYDAIVIFATMRTGSNLLERSLCEHPKIVGQSELFNNLFFGRAGNEVYDGIPIETRRADPASVLKYLLNKYDDKLPIFRYFHNHQTNALGEILENPRIAKIILKRNPVDSFISFSIARETKNWFISRRRHSNTIDPIQIVFDKDEYQNWLAKISSFYFEIETSLEDLGQSAHTVLYENIKNLNALNGIVEFLEIEPKIEILFEPVKRQNPLPRENYLRNPEILKSLEMPDWPEPMKPRPLSKPAVPKGYVVENLNRVFVPLEGNAGEEECQVLTRANQAPLRSIDSTDIALFLAENPNFKAYTRVINPRHRIYTILLQHMFGEQNGFDMPFDAVCRELLDFPISALPKENTRAALKAVGIEPRKLKKLYRDFIIYVRKELWSGLRDHIVSQAYWPQSQLVNNLNQHFELDILRDEDFPDGFAEGKLKNATPIRSPFLDAPNATADWISHNSDQQIYDLYQEDFHRFGYQIDEAVVKFSERV